jgi:hypothetical protein
MSDTPSTLYEDSYAFMGKSTVYAGLPSSHGKNNVLFALILHCKEFSKFNGVSQYNRSAQTCLE